MSLTKRFAQLRFETPSSSRRKSLPSMSKELSKNWKELNLTPIIEELNELKLQSSEKKVKDDFELDQRAVHKVDEKDLASKKLLFLDDFEEVNEANGSFSKFAKIKASYAQALGKFGFLS
jgi:hypothetical protein